MTTIRELIAYLEQYNPETPVIKMFGNVAINVANPPILGQFVKHTKGFSGMQYYSEAVSGSTLAALADEIITAVVL